MMTGISEAYKTAKLTLVFLIIVVPSLYLAVLNCVSPAGIIHGILTHFLAKWILVSAEVILAYFWIAIRQDERSGFKVCGARGSRH